jgi:hypothetical protein
VDSLGGGSVPRSRDRGPGERSLGDLDGSIAWAIQTLSDQAMPLEEIGALLESLLVARSHAAGRRSAANESALALKPFPGGSPSKRNAVSIHASGRLFERR